MRQRNMWIGETGRERRTGPISPEIVSGTETAPEAMPATDLDDQRAQEPIVVIEPVADDGWKLGSLGKSGKALDDLVPRTWPRSAR